MQNEQGGEVANTTAFSQQLAFLSKGCLDAELTEALAQVIKNVRATGKKGQLMLKVTVAMLNQRDENAVKIIPEVSMKLPRLAPYESVMYSTADGDLLRDDPKQRKLDLRQVPVPERGPLIDVPRSPQQPIAQNAPA